jgi:hypothetical protein
VVEIMISVGSTILETKVEKGNGYRDGEFYKKKAPYEEGFS